MYAIEFETNITSPFIPLHNYEQFLNQQVKVIVMAQDVVKPANRIDMITSTKFSRDVLMYLLMSIC